MSVEVGEEDEWLYGESADGAEEEPAAVEAAVENRAGADASVAEDPTDDAAVPEAPDDTTVGQPMDDGSINQEGEEGTRGKKRSLDGDQEEETEQREEAEGDESEDGDEEEESDDDDVVVTIGAIGDLGAGFGGAKRAGPPPDKKGKFSAEDFEGPGQINGVPAQDFNLDALEDKPWRKPGADITDYFNYGFSEDTWRAYCDRQKRMRYEAGHRGHPMSMDGDIKYIGVTGQQNIVFPKKFGMQPPGMRKDGPMNPIMMPMGMGMGMRRDGPTENTIQVMTADRREYSRKQFEMGPPPMMPPPFDMSMPPPPFPPPGGEFMGPPPDFFNHPHHHQPPPGDYYPEERPEYEEQQWMDSQWEMEGDGGSRAVGHSSLVIPLTKVVEVPPPPGENDDASEPSNSVKQEP